MKPTKYKHQIKYKHPLRAMMVAVLSALLLSTAHAVPNKDDRTLVFQNGLDGYAGALEVGIDQNKPGKLSAKPVNLWIERGVKDGRQTSAKQALVRFDGIFGRGASQIPPGANISRATLRLCTGSLKDAPTYHRIFLNRILVPWDKNAAWKYKAWGNDGIQADGREAAADSDAHFVPNLNNTAYEIDVTESLRAWARGEPNHGWVLHNIRVHLEAAAFISSRVQKQDQRPLLRVTFDANPANIAPQADKLTASPAGDAAATLSLHATDANKDTLDVTFHGRKQARSGPDFQVVLLPDTQYYTMKKHGGTPEMFNAQTEWIARNAKARNIAFVLHLGDITDTGDVYEEEWQIASKALYRLEDPALSGLPEGVPYAVAVGNHDQRKKGTDGKLFERGGGALLYNKYFGVNHFSGKSYYGGHYGDDNNNYYALFDAGAEKFIVLSLEYGRPARDSALLEWAAGLLKKHADRHAIVITHATVFPGVPGAFQADGGAVHEALKACKNLMLIVGGHTTGEGHRTDTRDGATVHSIVQDFQFDRQGGNGFLGILTFSPRENHIRVATYSPFADRWRTDPAAQYTLEYNFGTHIEPFAKIGTAKVRSGDTPACRWEGLEPHSDYEWFAEISDGGKTTRTETQLYKPAAQK
jgi:hypothetical protein